MLITVVRHLEPVSVPPVADPITDIDRPVALTGVESSLGLELWNWLRADYPLRYEPRGDAASEHESERNHPHERGEHLMHGHTRCLEPGKEPSPRKWGTLGTMTVPVGDSRTIPT